MVISELQAGSISIKYAAITLQLTAYIRGCFHRTRVGGNIQQTPDVKDR